MIKGSTGIYGRRIKTRSPDRPHDVIVAAKEKRIAHVADIKERKATEAVEAEQRYRASIDPNDPRWVQVAFDRIRQEPWWWFENFVWTSDQHDDKQRIKKFPMEKGYFKLIIEALMRDKIVDLVKSSKIMASWLASGLMLWKGRFFPHSECYIQCINEGAVAYFIDRVKTIHDHLPPWQQDTGRNPFTVMQAKFDNHSFIEGIPSGEHKIRGRAPSIFVMDEMAFMEMGGRALRAALPRILGDAMLLVISTPNMKNHFYRRTHPKDKKVIEVVHPIPESPQTEIKRYEGQTVITLHYTADPVKRDPEWIAAAKLKMKEEGSGDEAWEQEMECSFEVTGQPKLFPQYKSGIHEREIKFNPFLFVVRGWDFGFERPACVFWQKNIIDQVAILYSILGDGWDIHEFVGVVKEFCNKHFIAARRDKQIVPVRYEDFCDSAGKHETDKGSTIKILKKQYHIYPRCRYSHPADRARLIGNLLKIRKDGEPGLIVNNDSVNNGPILEGFRGGFGSKRDAAGVGTSIPFKDGYYDNVLDGFGYSIENKLVVQRDKDDDEEYDRKEKEYRKKLDKKYNSVAGYTAMAG